MVSNYSRHFPRSLNPLRLDTFKTWYDKHTLFWLPIWGPQIPWCLSQGDYRVTCLFIVQLPRQTSGRGEYELDRVTQLHGVIQSWQFQMQQFVCGAILLRWNTLQCTSVGVFGGKCILLQINFITGNMKCLKLPQYHTMTYVNTLINWISG